MADREKIIEVFVRLGKTMDALPADIAEKSARENPWFTTEDIISAARAISSEMLDPAKLRRWADGYGWAEHPQNVLLIMAGNIPMAGFFDMLCILVSGHRCVVKYSSKDTVLMDFAACELRRLHPGIPIIPAGECTHPDAVIASGSDNAIRHLKSLYAGLPSLYRGNRASVAILDDSESEDELIKLAADIFSYSGLGCRNVSHLLLPEGYDTQRLARILSLYPKERINPKYLNNFRQHSALMEISGHQYITGSFFLLRESPEFPSAVSEISYGFYDSPHAAANWVTGRESQIQCVVALESWNSILPFPVVPFGRAQSPTLYDFPDRVDTMRLLAEF